MLLDWDADKEVGRRQRREELVGDVLEWLARGMEEAIGDSQVSGVRIRDK